MSSAHAQRFNSAARPRLWDIHSEEVTYREKSGNTYINERTLQGVWKRVDPEVEDADNIGAQEYTGEATLVVKVEDMPTAPGPKAEIVREGIVWVIRGELERNDEWTWILHLARPDNDVRLPVRVRG